MVCSHCGKEVEARENGSCPECSLPLAAADAPTVVHPPQASALAAGDAELLAKGVMRPPTRIGTSGKIGRFEIVKPIGRGGMADVFLATEPVTNTPVALKLLKRELAEDPRVAKTFLNEARCMYQLSHPGILKVLEVSSPDEGSFFVMPLVESGSLDRRIRTDGKLTDDEVLEFATQIAEALAYAHKKGLIHRDLKPGNVLLDEGGRVLLTDFGLVRSLAGDSVVNVACRTPEGTPAYMSPGVAAGQAEDTRCDIYSFGTVLYEMLTGCPPYEGKSVEEVLDDIRNGPPAPVATLAPGAPRGLVAVTEWCMARALRDRYATMDDVVEDLKRVAGGKSPSGPHGGGTAGSKIMRLAVTAVVTVLVVTAAGMGWLAYLDRGQKTVPVDEMCRQADALYEAGDHSEAEGVYNAVVDAQPMHSRALFGLGKIAHERDMRREATEYLNKAQRANPKDAEIATMLFDLLVEIGHTRPARHTLEVWLEADPGNEEALALMAKLPEEDETEGERRPGGERPGPERHRPPPLRDGERGRRPPPRGPGGFGPPEREDDRPRHPPERGRADGGRVE